MFYSSPQLPDWPKQRQILRTRALITRGIMMEQFHQKIDVINWLKSVSKHFLHPLIRTFASEKKLLIFSLKNIFVIKTTVLREPFQQHFISKNFLKVGFCLLCNSRFCNVCSKGRENHAALSIVHQTWYTISNISSSILSFLSVVSNVPGPKLLSCCYV